ncbi:hypothetical protein ACI65C_006664 [Semiaphis heraclei]
MSFPIDRYASVCLINTPSESGHCGRVGLLDVTRRDRRRVAAVNSALFLTTSVASRWHYFWWLVDWSAESREERGKIICNPIPPPAADAVCRAVADVSSVPVQLTGSGGSGGSGSAYLFLTCRCVTPPPGGHHRDHSALVTARDPPPAGRKTIRRTPNDPSNAKRSADRCSETRRRRRLYYFDNATITV